LLIEKPRTIGTKKYADTDYEEGTPKWGSARFNKAMHLVLDVQVDEGDTPERFIFDAGEIEEVVIGRKDPVTGTAPEVDLSPVNGLEKGVSRRHALIVRRDGALHIMDNGSANGTYLNGQRLVAQQPRILRDGDDIRLGHLVLRVTFNPITAPPQSP
jgi:predicted component of type VI protein secretion system